MGLARDRTPTVGGFYRRWLTLGPFRKPVSSAKDRSRWPRRRGRAGIARPCREGVAAGKPRPWPWGRGRRYPWCWSGCGGCCLQVTVATGRCPSRSASGTRPRRATHPRLVRAVDPSRAFERLAPLPPPWRSTPDEASRVRPVGGPMSVGRRTTSAARSGLATLHKCSLAWPGSPRAAVLGGLWPRGAGYSATARQQAGLM
jgi:hypothetical protein